MVNKIKIGIIDDNELFVETIKLYFSISDTIEVVFSTEVKEDILALCRAFQPDVVLMDMHLGYFSGIDGMKLVHRSFPKTKVIMCTVSEDSQTLLDSISNGANGYLLKTTPATQIELAILESCKGGAPITPTMATQLFQVLRQSNLFQRNEDSLTPRENDILQGLVKGLSYKELATKLNISLGTVRTHIENIYSKLEVNSKSQAVAKYLRTSNYADI